ncbi:MAG: 5-formyltetrahydrofolate cyclo-ligase [Deltaproteobacteria bacterium]|nr:5-formyltetrahydrofolate cyclo-ligase [Deltaproteobacteria bacterium]
MAVSAKSKRDLRRRLLAHRGALDPASVQAAGEAVIRHLTDASFFEGARTIGIYAAVRGEVPLEPLFAHLGAQRLAYPRMEPGSRTLSFWVLEPGAALVPGPFEIPTPPPGRSLPVPLDALDLILVPGVAFDREGNRLGQGGGYYDATLPETPAIRVGVAHGFQILEALPRDAHDAPVDHLVTPDGVLPVLGKAAK